MRGANGLCLVVTTILIASVKAVVAANKVRDFMEVYQKKVNKYAMVLNEHPSIDLTHG